MAKTLNKYYSPMAKICKCEKDKYYLNICEVHDVNIYKKKPFKPKENGKRK